MKGVTTKSNAVKLTTTTMNVTQLREAVKVGVKVDVKGVTVISVRLGQLPVKIFDTDEGMTNVAYVADGNEDAIKTVTDAVKVEIAAGGLDKTLLELQARIREIAATRKATAKKLREDKAAATEELAEEADLSEL